MLVTEKKTRKATKGFVKTNKSMSQPKKVMVVHETNENQLTGDNHTEQDAKATPALISSAALLTHHNKTTEKAMIPKKSIVTLPFGRRTKSGEASKIVTSKSNMPNQTNNAAEGHSAPESLTWTAASSTIEAGSDEVRRCYEIQAKIDASLTCSHLQELLVQRRAAMRAMQKINLQQLAFVRRWIGFDPNADEATRSKINKTAATVLKKIVDGEEVDEQYRTVADHARTLVLGMQAAVNPIETERTRLEKEMSRLAQTLPAYSFVEAIKGFGELGLAIIVGEAGDLSKYANPGKLWKRMGLAVFNGKSQRRVTDAEEAIMQGYSPQRRSSMYTLGDSLLKSQIRKVKDDAGEDTEERTSLGEYGRIYLDRKAYESARPETKSKMHAHRKAQRYVEKRLLKDLWMFWNKAK